MKVRELIEALKKLPQDKTVYAEGSGGYYEIQIDDYKNETHPDDETYVVISPSGRMQ